MADTNLDSAVRLTILEGFLAGRAPSVESVAKEIGESPDRVAASFDRLAAGRAVVLAPGTRDLLMAAPFAAGPSAFRVRTPERFVYANCVWDALGVAALLEGAGRPSDIDVETDCADCGAPLRLRVRAGALESEPAGAVAHFAVPAARWWADIVFT